jgi:hypothetical protein
MVGIWLRAFALTLAVELPIGVALLRTAEPLVGRRIGAVALANLATHPAVWFVFPALGLSYGLTIAVAEAWAVVIELVAYVLLFPEAPRARLAGIALVANGASWAAGILVRSLGGWIG